MTTTVQLYRATGKHSYVFESTYRLSEMPCVGEISLFIGDNGIYAIVLTQYGIRLVCKYGIVKWND